MNVLTTAANAARKAIVATLGAFGVWLGTAPADGVTSGEWAALASCLVVGLIAWLTPNDPAPEDGGQSYVPMLVVFVIGFLLGALCYANGILVGG